MIEPTLHFQKKLEDYMDFLEKLNPRALDLFDTMTSVDVAHQDPYHNVRGQDALKSLQRRRFELSEQGRYKVYDFAWGRKDATVYLRWGFLFKPPKSLFKKNDDLCSIDGMSEILFTPNKEIGAITEYWSSYDGFDNKAYAAEIED